MLQRDVWCHKLRIPSLHAGFGRIGRLVLRATLNRKDVNVVAINGEPFGSPAKPLQLFSGACVVNLYVTRVLPVP